MASIQSDSPGLSFNPLDNRDPEALPSLADDDELWEVFIELVLEHRSRISKSLDDTLNTLLLFAALFSAVNVGIIAVSLPTLNVDPARGSEPRSSTLLPSEYALNANQVFSSSLTCSLLAAFFSLVGKQWLRHYTRPFPTAHLENLRTLQRQLDGTLRWRFEGVVEIVLMSLLQISLILFLVEWIPFLHWQGDTVSYPDNGLANFGAFMLVAMLACSLWDPWCSYQTPFTTELPTALKSLFRSLKNLAETTVITPQTIRNALPSTFHRLKGVVGVVREHPSVLLHIFRRPEDTSEGTDIKSLRWMLEHAPRGRPLRLVAHQIVRAKLSSELSDYQEIIRRSPHIRRLHETFWDTLRRLIRTEKAGPPEVLVDIAIFGKSNVATSYQWPDISIEDVLRASFKEYASPHQSKLSFEDFQPFLKRFEPLT